MTHLLYKFVFALFVTLLVTGAVSSQTAGEQGIKLYNQGDFKGAITLLKTTDEIIDLYYFGLANEKIGETGKAKDAFKRAFAESYKLFFKKFGEWQNAQVSGSEKNLSDLMLETKANNAVGLSAAEKAFSLKSDIFQTNEWRIKAKVLLESINLAKENGKIYANSDKSLTGVKVIERSLIPFPRDSDGVPYLRLNESPNKPILIKIFIVVGADGNIKLLMPTDETVDVYTAQVISGVEKFKFQPAKKDGIPVACATQILYSFSKR